jgi:hypothetical protein
MPGPNPRSLEALVDVDRGIISREIFVSEEIYRQELERVFVLVGKREDVLRGVEGGLEDRPAQDRAGPERAAHEEPHVFLLS